MRITAKIDYAVRACVELAVARDAGFVTADRVGKAQGIPASFLLGILNQLRRSGLVESRRGAEGGFRLAAEPARIAVADVIRAIDGPLANIAGSSRRTRRTRVRGRAPADVVALRAAMRSVLEHVTIADIASGTLPDDVARLVGSDEAWVTRPSARKWSCAAGSLTSRHRRGVSVTVGGCVGHPRRPSASPSATKRVTLGDQARLPRRACRQVSPSGSRRSAPTAHAPGPARSRRRSRMRRTGEGCRVRRGTALAVRPLGQVGLALALQRRPVGATDRHRDAGSRRRFATLRDVTRASSTISP
ncbi:Rrf2 family transcriptional regulator [Oerskovia sp. M15]